VGVGLIGRCHIEGVGLIGVSNIEEVGLIRWSGPVCSLQITPSSVWGVG
jgi:hypothetical protein